MNWGSVSVRGVSSFQRTDGHYVRNPTCLFCHKNIQLGKEMIQRPVSNNAMLIRSQTLRNSIFELTFHLKDYANISHAYIYIHIHTHIITHTHIYIHPHTYIYMYMICICLCVLKMFRSCSHPTWFYCYHVQVMPTGIPKRWRCWPSAQPTNLGPQRATREKGECYRWSAIL